MNLRLLFILPFLFLFCNSKTKEKPSNLQGIIDEFANNKTHKHASIGVSVMDVETGQLVAQKDAIRTLLPASSLKVLPTATALALLNEQQITTTLHHTGTISNGVLNGDLIIKGMGDPSFGSSLFDETQSLGIVINSWISKIKANGISQINGNIVVDASYLPSQSTPSTWQWNDLGNYYGAGVFGMNAHDNLYELHFQQKSRMNSTPAIVRTQPKQDLEFTNELKSAKAGSGDNAYIFGAPYTTQRFVRGTIPVGKRIFKIKGAIHNPPAFLAQYFKNELEIMGLVAKKAEVSRMPIPVQSVIAQHQSPSILSIATRTNQKSVNLYAEALLRIVGKELGSNGSVEESLGKVIEYWKQQGWDTEGLSLKDGSGLSPRNGISSFQLAQLLQIIWKSSSRDRFLSTLAVGGQSGTLKKMFKNSSAKGHVFAKSGSISRVKSYTGYVQAKSGKWYSFSILSNNYACSSSQMRGMMEKVMEAIYLI